MSLQKHHRFRKPTLQQQLHDGKTKRSRSSVTFKALQQNVSFSNDLISRRELVNGSIIHKRLGKRYDIGQYEILHFAGNAGARRQYRVCSSQMGQLFINLPSEIAIKCFKAASIISMICNGVHIFIYTSIKQLRDLPSQILLAMTVAFFPIQLIFAADGLMYSR